MHRSTHRAFAARMWVWSGGRLTREDLLAAATLPDDQPEGFPRRHHRNRKTPNYVRERVREARKRFLSGVPQEAARLLGIASHYALDNLLPLAGSDPAHDEMEQRIACVDRQAEYHPEPKEWEGYGGQKVEEQLELLLSRRFPHGAVKEADLYEADLFLCAIARCVAQELYPVWLRQQLADEVAEMLSSFRREIDSFFDNYLLAIQGALQAANKAAAQAAKDLTERMELESEHHSALARHKIATTYPKVNKRLGPLPCFFAVGGEKILRKVVQESLAGVRQTLKENRLSVREGYHLAAGACLEEFRGRAAKWRVPDRNWFLVDWTYPETLAARDFDRKLTNAEAAYDDFRRKSESLQWEAQSNADAAAERALEILARGFALRRARACPRRLQMGRLAAENPTVAWLVAYALTAAVIVVFGQLALWGTIALTTTLLVLSGALLASALLHWHMKAWGVIAGYVDSISLPLGGSKGKGS